MQGSEFVYLFAIKSPDEFLGFQFTQELIVEFLAEFGLS